MTTSMTANNSSTEAVSRVTSLDLANELASVREHKPSTQGLHSKLLLKTDDMRMVLIAMDGGAKIMEHHADGTVSIHAVEGALRIHVQGQAHELHAGQVLILASGIRHDVEAYEDSALLLTISWPSGEKLESMAHRGYGS